MVIRRKKINDLIIEVNYYYLLIKHIMAENNYTIWQRLTKVFGPDSTLDQQPPVYKFDKKELLKTRDKARV